MNVFATWAGNLYNEEIFLALTPKKLLLKLFLTISFKYKK